MPRNGPEYGLRITADGRLARTAVNALAKSNRDLDQSIQALNKTAERSARQAARGTRAQNQTATATRDLKNEIQRLEAQNRRHINVSLEGVRASREVSRQIEAQTTAMRRAAAANQRNASSMQSTSSAGRELAGVLRLIAGAVIVRQIQSNAQEMRALQLAFEDLSGSARAGAEEQQFVARSADKLGQSNRELQRTYRRIFAAARDTNLEGEESREIFLGVTAAMTALGGSSDQTSRALNAVEQIISKGRLSAEELRQQLGDQLPGAFKLAVEASGLTSAEFNRLLERGEILAGDILPKLADILISRYLPAAERVANESGGQARRIQNAWESATLAIGQAFNEGFASNAPGIIAALEDIGDSAAFENLADALGTVIGLLGQNSDVVIALAAAYGVGRASTAAFTFATNVSSRSSRNQRLALTALTSLIGRDFVRANRAATLATTGFSRALLANPIGAVATGLSLALSAFTAYSLFADDAADATNRFAAANRELGDSVQLVADIRKRAGADGLQFFIEQEAALKSKVESDIADLESQIAAAEQAVATARADFQNTPLVNENERKLLAASLTAEINNLKQLNAQLIENEDVLANVTAEIDEATKSLNRLNDETDEAASQQALRAFAQLADQLDPVAARVKAIAEAEAGLDAALKDGQITRDQYQLYYNRLITEIYPDAENFLRNFSAANQEEIRLLTLGNRERQIEIAVRRQVNVAKQRGIELSDQNIEAIRTETAALIDAREQVQQNQREDQAAERQFRQALKNRQENVQRAIADGIVAGFEDGLDGIGSFFDEIERLIVRTFAENIAAGIVGGTNGGFLGGAQQAPGTGQGIFGFLNGSLESLGQSINDLGSAFGLSNGRPTTITLPTANGEGVQVPGPTPTGPTLLGSLSQGLQTGLLTSSLLGGNSAGGAIGGALGQAIGTAAFGPVGGLVGGILGGAGGLLGSLFGSSRAAGTTLSIGQDGLLDASDPRFRNRRSDTSVASGLGNIFTDQLNTLALALGGELRRGLTIGEIGFRNDEFFFDPTPNASTRGLGRDRGDTEQFETEQEAVRAALASALSRGAVTGVSDEVARFLTQTTRDTLDRVLANADFLAAYDDLLVDNSQISEAEAAIRELNETFEESIQRARQLGLAAEPLFDAWQREIDRLRQDFDDSIRLQLLDFTDPARAQLERLQEEQIARLEEAYALGADVAEVQRLNSLEWNQAVEELDRQVNSLFFSFDRGLMSFLNDLDFGSNSTLTPSEQLARAREDFNNLVAGVRSGDEDAAGQIFDSARRLLDLSQSAFGSTQGFNVQEEFVRRTLESLRDQLPRTDVTAIAEEIGQARVAEEQIANLTSILERQNERMIDLLGTIASNTDPANGGFFGGGGGGFEDTTDFGSGFSNDVIARVNLAGSRG